MSEDDTMRKMIRWHAIYEKMVMLQAESSLTNPMFGQFWEAFLFTYFKPDHPGLRDAYAAAASIALRHGWGIPAFADAEVQLDVYIAALKQALEAGL